MNVAELIEELKQFDPEMEVHFAYNYGDHWRTTVAPRVDNISEGVVEFSDYHRMPKLVDEYDDEDGCGDDVQDTPRRVVILE